jgi:exopolysaccharide biosynthesis WecB/TagA/CpsF family protein
LPVYFYGSRPDVLERLTANLRTRFPALRVAGARPSLFRRSTEEERAFIIEEIRRAGARIIFVGLGCPRQEVWVYENARALGLPAIAVGAAFDFHAGLLPQAPRALQDKGLEWAFRLIKEPRRLWRRYLFLNPLFVSLLLMQWSGLSRFSDQGVEPDRLEYFA